MMNSIGLLGPRLGVWVAACVLVIASVSQAPAQKAVIINEIMANNATVITPNNDITDWIELYNPTTNVVDLGAWRLTDTPTNTAKYVFPENVTIGPHEFLLVYCDSVTNQGGLHTPFKLGADGSFLALYDRNGFVHDYLNFGIQLADYTVGRQQNEADAFQLTLPTPGASNVVVTQLGDPSKLLINEWLALDVSVTTSGKFQTNSDWIEIYNPETNIVALGGLVLSDTNMIPATNSVLWPLSFIDPLGFKRFFADDKTNAGNHVNFKLSSTYGDDIYLYQADGISVIDHVQFGPMPANRSEGRLPDGDTNIVLFPYGRATPGDSNLIPMTNSLVVNEVLAHTDPPLQDAVEFFNPWTTNIDIGGWWLSNNKERPYKYRVPANTLVPPRGFKVFYEDDFNPHRTGNEPEFTFNSAHGDAVYLFQTTPDGRLTGFIRGNSFEASANGVSFGRVVKSDGRSDLWPTVRLTIGASNAGPRIGPLVINEIHYHPPDIVAGTNRIDDSTNEFIEVANITTSTVLLYDPNVYVRDDNGQIFADGHTNTWRLRGKVDYDFPLNQSLGPGKFLVVVNFDPEAATNVARTAAFRAKFNVPATVPLYGPYRGKLGNQNGSVELQRPDPPQGPLHPDFRFVPHITVDWVSYDDLPPWPTTADGTGNSLQRKFASSYGNDPINWTAMPPSPGRPNAYAKPIITTQPQSQVVKAGDPAEFRVAVTGTPPLEYQWLFKGEPMINQTSDTLTIFFSVPTWAGPYSVVINNPVGAVTSKVATLTVDCGYLLTPGGASFASAGGATNIDVFALGGCTWTPSTTNTWIQIQPGADNTTGPGPFSFIVEANPLLVARTGYIQLGDKALKVTQYGPDLLAPSVSISTPLQYASTTNVAVVTKGAAVDNNEVVRVEYSVGGGPFLPGIRASNSTARVWYWSGFALLAPGTNVVEARSFDVAGNASIRLLRRYFRIVKQPLSVVVQGSGYVTPGLNGMLLNFGQGYAITAVPGPGYVFSNWVSGGVVLTNGPTLRFLMASNLVLQANCVPNPFLPVAGTYAGLFREPGVVRQHERSGSFLLTVTASRTYSGRFLSGARLGYFSGKFDLDGRATNRLRLGTNWVTAQWFLDLGPARSGRIVGTLGDGVWLADLEGDRPGYNAISNPAAFAGRYTFAVTGVTDVAISALGHGSGISLMGKGGNASLSGSLADNTPLAAAGMVWRDGQLPLYVPLYGGRGSLWGKVVVNPANPAAPFEADLNWIKPALPLPYGKYYPAGFNNDSRLVGGVYQAPLVRTNRVLNIVNGMVSFEGGNLLAPFTNFVTLTPPGLVLNQTALNSNRLTMSISLADGRFTGLVQVPGTAKYLSYRGALLQNLNAGLGCFLGTNQSGGVRFEASP